MLIDLDKKRDNFAVVFHASNTCHEAIISLSCYQKHKNIHL